jgi:hypothetical protein
MLRLAVFLAALCVAVPAMARNITSEVQYYKDIEVSFSENAHVCGLKDAAPFVELTKARLQAMDVPHNPDAIVSVVILVTARASGLLKQKCAAHVGVQLQAEMNSSFLNVNAYEGDDQTFVMLSERAYEFPMVFYQTGRVYTDLAPSMPEVTLEVLGLLLDDLAKARSLK